MKELKKTLLVFFYFNLLLSPFIYLVGFAVFQTHDWFKIEFETIEQQGLKIVIIISLLMESYFLYLAKKF
jgi:hypothetical protein